MKTAPSAYFFIYKWPSPGNSKERRAATLLFFISLLSQIFYASAKRSLLKNIGKFAVFALLVRSFMRRRDGKFSFRKKRPLSGEGLTAIEKIERSRAICFYASATA